MYHYINEVPVSHVLVDIQLRISKDLTHNDSRVHIMGRNITIYTNPGSYLLACVHMHPIKVKEEFRHYESIQAY